MYEDILSNIKNKLECSSVDEIEGLEQKLKKDNSELEGQI